MCIKSSLYVLNSLWSNIHANVCLLLFSQYIGSNSLTGGIPSEFGMITSLTNLDLGKIIRTNTMATLYAHVHNETDACDFVIVTLHRWEYSDRSYTNRAWRTQSTTRYQPRLVLQ